MNNIEFSLDDTLEKPIMEVVFTQDLIDSEPDFDSDLSLKENLLAIKWHDEVFGEGNYTTIKISLSKKDYDSIFSK